MTERHWVDNVADLISGRTHNSLVSLNIRLDKQEKEMTENERRIHEAAQNIVATGTRITDGVNALLDKLTALDVPREDLSDELAELDAATTALGQIGDRLTPAPAGTPAETTPADQGQISAGPIDHADPIVTPLVGGSGPTDAGVPVEVAAPGDQVSPDVPTTPLATDATAEAGITVPAAPDVPAVPEETTPVADEEIIEDDPSIDFDTAPPVGGPATATVASGVPAAVPEAPATLPVEDEDGE